MRLFYRVISCDVLGGSNACACAWNSQLASSLCQIHVACSAMKMSGFPLEIVKNIQAMKCYSFYSSDEPEIEEILDGSPIFRFAQISPLLWCFSRFWSTFIGIEVSNEEKYSILRILYCYSLQQLIFLAFCNDFDTHYRVLAYILPEMTSEANSSHSPLFLGREHGNVDCEQSLCFLIVRRERSEKKLGRAKAGRAANFHKVMCFLS